MQRQIAGHLEDEVAKEENARAQAVNCLAELQVVEHLQLGKADVDAVQIGRDVANEQQRQQAPGDARVGGIFRV